MCRINMYNYFFCVKFFSLVKGVNKYSYLILENKFIKKIDFNL